jgi:hypothetical protein
VPVPGLSVSGAAGAKAISLQSYTGATNIIYGTLQVNNANTFTNTSAINMTGYSRLNVNAVNSLLAELSTANKPHFPASSPTQWLFQGPPAESKLLANPGSHLCQPT